EQSSFKRSARSALCRASAPWHNSGHLRAQTYNSSAWMAGVSLEQIVHYVTYLTVRIFVCLVQALRMETCERLADLLATIATDVVPLRRKLIGDNLRHAFPDLPSDRRRKIAKRMWKHLFLLVAEVAHAPRKIHETNWRDYVRLKDAD